MDHRDEFRFYTSENDGYRGGFGDYTDPIPTTGGPTGPEQPPKKRGGLRKAIALVLACALVGGGAGMGGAALYSRLSRGAAGTTT